MNGFKKKNIAKSKTKANKLPKIEHKDENINNSNQKFKIEHNSSAGNNMLDMKGEDIGGCRISHILPDINWYPDPSKCVKGSIIKRDLVDQYPLTFKAMNFMLQNDFELPRLNSMQRRSLFKYPSSEEKDIILQMCPHFKSGRFNEEEKNELIKSLRQYFDDLEFSHDLQKEFIKEMENLPACHGGARGSTSHNLIYVKLYFACHVAGVDFLKYRLAFDLYNTLISLWNSEFDSVMKPSKIKKETTSDEQKANESEDEGVKGRFKTEDSCELIRCVVSHLHSKALPIDTNDMNLSDIDWKQIQKQTFRTPRSMQKHFTLVIWPLLKDGQPEELQERTWQKNLLKLLVEKKIAFIQDIDWKELQKTHFPNNTTIQLRTFVSNQVNKRLKHVEQQGEGKPRIHDILKTVLERFASYKFLPKSDSPLLCKQKEIIDCYEDFKDSLSHSSKENISLGKRPAPIDEIIQNNNFNERETPVVIPVKKRKKTKHKLFSEKSCKASNNFN